MISKPQWLFSIALLASVQAKNGQHFLRHPSRKLQTGTCKKWGDSFVLIDAGNNAPPAFNAPTKNEDSNGFAQNSCPADEWVPADNSDSPTGMVRCCAGQHGKDGDDWGKCDTSSCVNNFNMENRNCFNYGYVKNGNGGGSDLCPYPESDKAICDTSFYDDQNDVNCRTNPAGKNYQTHCLGKVKCNTVGVTIPNNGHSDGTAAFEDPANTECAGAENGFVAGADCFYDGFSENWKVCEGETVTTPSPTATAATPSPTAAPTTPSPTAAPTASPTTAAPTDETFPVGETVETDDGPCTLAEDCSCEEEVEARVADDTPEDGASPGGRGDPHFVKWGGDKFDFHGACDLVLLEAPDFDNGKGLTVQIRTEIKRWWSYISHVAIKIGDDILEVQSSFDDEHKARYWVNHKPGKPIITQMWLPFTLGGHQVRYRDLSKKSFQFKIFLPQDQSIIIKTTKDFLRIEMDQIHSVEDFGTSRGLMGSFPEGKLVGRDGVTPMEDDLNAYGQEWQVSMNEPMLFYKVQAPQTPQKCKLPKVTSMERRMLLSGISQEEAEELCQHADDVQDCIFDVVSTGDPDVVEEYM